MLRKNSRLRAILGSAGTEFLEHAAGSIERILPHVAVSTWKEIPWMAPGGYWAGKDRKALNVRISIGKSPGGRTLSATVRRRRVAIGKETGRQTLDVREHDICRRIALRSSSVIATKSPEEPARSLTAIRDAFDEQIVAEHLKAHHALELHFDEVLKALHQLSEQTYENKSLTFGCIVDPAKDAGSNSPVFPTELLRSKKYKALSDGFRTAYHVASNGALIGFVDLREFPKHGVLSLGHMYPEWAEDLAAASRDGRCGLCLSRQGGYPGIRGGESPVHLSIRPMAVLESRSPCDIAAGPCEGTARCSHLSREGRREHLPSGPGRLLPSERRLIRHRTQPRQ